MTKKFKFRFVAFLTLLNLLGCQIVFAADVSVGPMGTFENGNNNNAPSSVPSINAPTYTPTYNTPSQNNSGWQQIDSTNQNRQTEQNPYGSFLNDNQNSQPFMQNEQETTITEEELDDFFEQLIRTNALGEDPVGTFLRRIPRYGMSFFRQPASTFAPSDNSPVTQNYRINIGDQLSLTIWGIPEEGNYTFEVNRDGMAVIPHLGSVRLAGYTLDEAERILQARLNQYYTGYQMNLSMGRLSSIMIYVTGNARRPGAYTVSSFATLVNALLVSGGPSVNGSLRRIELKRNGRTITVFDMYALLLRGDKSHDVQLQAGDVIYIPPVGDLVGLTGIVRNPGVYELNGATRVKDLLDIAKLTPQTSQGRIQFYRVYENEYGSAFEGEFEAVQDMVLKDGDILRLFPVTNMASSVTLSGPVARPGVFIIVPGRTRVWDILKRAGGLTNTAGNMAEVTRVTPSIDGPVNERFVINLNEVKAGNPEHNITLENTDHITVMVIPNWRTNIQVSITGEVVRPGTYAMLPGEKISDLITRAGGFTERAYLRGAIFTRPSVATEQRRALNEMADTMERELLENMQNTNTSSTNTATSNAEFNRRRELIDKLRNIDIMGRIITKIDTPKNIINTAWDYELENGDAIVIPEKPLTVTVTGAVYTASSQVFRPGLSINSYVNAAGGAVKSAHKRLIYLLKSDGSTIRLTRNTSMLSSKQWTAPRGFSSVVEPGDTIVVPVKYIDRASIERFKDAVDVIYKVAVAVGVILKLD